MKPRIPQKAHIIVLALACASLWGCARGPQHDIEVGNRYLKEKRYVEAALNYRTAIQKDPRSVEAQYGFGLTQIANHEIRAAIFTLGTVLQLQPDHQAALISLGDLHLQILLGDERRPKESREELGKIAKKLLAGDPNSYDGMRFRGHLAIVDGKPKEARESFSHADRIRPGQPKLQLALADAMARDNLTAGAEQLALAIIDKNKSFGPAYDFLQLQYVHSRRPADAERVMRLKADNNPQVADFQLQLAGYYLVAQRPLDADRVFQRILGNLKNFPEAHLRIGDLYLQLGRDSDAQRQFEEGLRTDPARAADYKKRLARQYFAANRKGEALQLASDLVKSTPEDDEASRMRAAFLLEEGKGENLDQVIGDYTRLLAKNPKDATISFQLGRAYLLKGRTEQAAEQFEQATRRNKTYLAPRLALAQIKATQGHYGDALHQLDEILALDSGNARVQLLRAATLRNLRRLPEARTELTRFMRGAPDDVDGQVELGLLDLADGRLQEAEAVFGKLYRSRGTDLRAAAGLVKVYSAQGHYGKAIQLLNEQLEKDPSVSVRQALVTVAIRAGSAPLALEQLEKIVSLNPLDAAPYVQIGQLQMDRGNTNEGLIALRKASELAPKDGNVLVALAVGLQQGGRIEEAKAVYQRTLALDSQHPVALNNLAYLYAESGNNLNEAMQMATTASQKQPSNRNFLDTLGMVHLKSNMAYSAVQIFQSLATAEPNNPTFRMHLGLGLMQKGDKPKARKEFQAALSVQNSPDQEKRLRDLLASTGADR